MGLCYFLGFGSSITSTSQADEALRRAREDQTRRETAKAGGGSGADR